MENKNIFKKLFDYIYMGKDNIFKRICRYIYWIGLCIKHYTKKFFIYWIPNIFHLKRAWKNNWIFDAENDFIR